MILFVGKVKKPFDSGERGTPPCTLYGYVGHVYCGRFCQGMFFFLFLRGEVGVAPSEGIYTG